MQPGLLVIVLAGESQVIGKLDRIEVRIFIGRCSAEGITVPAPDDLVGGIGDRPWRVQVVGMNVMNGRALADGYGDIVKINRLLDRCTGTVVFTNELACLVIDKIVRGGG